MCSNSHPKADTIGSILTRATGALARAGVEEPRRRARLVAEAALGFGAAELLAHPEREVAGPQIDRLRWMLRRMLAGEPLTRITGKREFWGLEFALSADTLDPRPDSEAVIAAVLARTPQRVLPLRLLDLGTGSGCLLLALLSELPYASGIGVDIAIGAAATARMNAAALGLSKRARFFVGEWGAALSGCFAVIIANPPYIGRAALADLPRAVHDYDPRRALDGGPDGLAGYRAIAAGLPRLLTPEGLFVGEIGVGQVDAVSRLLDDAGLLVEAIEADFAGIARCVIARLGRR